ncbi:MAG TPA: peptidylprolyl isomerase [Sphingorhabdus lacus]|jgi:peptidyl-prolyl cis-trans isomerase SurA|uniref:Parvulin-like PPIase n=1 Tax=Sphingorhabdus lacus TaxID=392610 RepID=A0A6I6L3S5_9SPHN|nr:peptidylprolyl isomerase [Sphingorhabdus lacus]QGY80179.1 peptidylprolyl isomerase [Sphingorhabdus lacus]HNW17666.1 peptidylprolyl isomerase [Sphingorhabdus lacus]HPV67942.1 peptidylprolyl isomerase [Sphingorhabdus lacus]
MKFSKRFSIAALLATATALTPSVAQTVSDEVTPEARLDIPDGQTLFGKNDPNVRRATAQVNGEIITGTDIDHRLALIVAANNNQLPPEEVARFRAQILTNLIDETLQIQEAAANEIEVTDAEVNQYFDRVAQQNFNRPANEVEKYLISIGSSVATLKRQIKGELSWSRLLSRNVRPSANVSDDEVNAIIERIKATKGTTEYRIGEIYLSATPETMPAVTENARKIMDQLRQGGNFVAYARQFSEASTASVGGDLGWLSLAQLPPSLATAASNMRANEIQAVPSPGGISILLLIDRRQVATSDPRDSVLSLKQIAITFPAGTTEAQVAPLVKRFSEETGKISGCGAADEMARQLNADVVNRDGIKVRDLPAPLQQVMLDLQVGQSTPPYGSLEDGVRVFVMCGRDAPQEASSESFDEIMSRLEEERVNKRARIYLRDLRRDAVIEYN